MSEAKNKLPAPYDLSDEEIDRFFNANILPAAIHFWDKNFSDPELTFMCSSQEKQFENPEGQPAVEVGVAVAYTCTLGTEGELESGLAHDQSIDIWLQGFREDITRELQTAKDTELTVWEQMFYEFPLNGLPSVSREYVIKDSNGEDVDAPGRSLKRFIKKISQQPQFNPRREPTLNSQDCIDVHNILLSLEVPEGAIALTT